MLDLSREELNAIGTSIQHAWQNGEIKDPKLAYHLLTGSEKLHQEWARSDPANGGAAMPAEPREAPEPVAKG